MHSFDSTRPTRPFSRGIRLVLQPCPRRILAAFFALAIPGASVAAQEVSASPSTTRTEVAAEQSRPAETAAHTALHTVSALIERSGQWQIALKVEREEEPQENESEEERPRRRRRNRIGGREVTEYFERPDGYVSGLWIDGEGHVLTTAYNVAGKVKSIHVALPTGQKVAATVLGRSEVDDLALLQIDSDALASLPTPPPVPWGDSAKLRPGQFVFVTGRSPDPGALTVTRGIVSAVGRNGNRMIQTDAELNYGNVGGPVMDLDGRVVALAGYVGGERRRQWGINSGIGFGTKANVIREILPDLLAGKDFEPPQAAFLGVGPGEQPAGDDGGAGSGFRFGVVSEGSGAMAGGIRVGDVILEFNGQEIDNFAQLRRAIFALKPGDTAPVKLRRGEEMIEVELTLGTRPENDS